MLDSDLNKQLVDKQLVALPYLIVFLEIITFLSMDMYLPALPAIANEFRVSQDVAQYTSTFWFLGSMSMQLVLGPLSELYGRKKILMISIAIFLVTNLVLAHTDNISIFLLARFLQGTTVCAVIVAGYALIHGLYQGKKAVQILAIMSSISILAPALGPTLGALILTYSSWYNIFNLLAVSAVIGIIAIYSIIPLQGDLSQKNKMNLSQIIRDYKLIFTNKRFLQSAFLYFSIVICFFIWIVESPFIIIKHYQKTELFFGIVQLFVFSGYILGAQTAKYLISRIPTKKLSDFGLSTVIVFISLFIFFSYFHFNLLLITAAMVGIAFGASSLSGLMNRMAIESSDRPMASRVAVYSLIISLSASTGSILVTFVNDMTFDNIGMLMAACVFFAVIIYSRLRSQINLK